jgi:hypothetical protein
LRKTIAILLLLLFLTNEFSYFTVFLTLRNTARIIQNIRINSKNESDDFAVIKIKESDFRNNTSGIKFLDDSEMKYNDELYDILDIAVKDSMVYIYCLKDETEDLFTKTYCLHFQSNPARKFSLNFFRFNNALKMVAYFCTNEVNIYISKTELISDINHIIYINPYKEIPSPPPKLS